MSTDNKDILEKAHHKALHAHFKKTAAHHEKKAAIHEDMHEAHKAHSEHHQEMAEQHEEPIHKGHHKKSAAFHKSMASHHEKCMKAHTAHAEACHKVAEACLSEDAKKVAQLLEFELGLVPELDKSGDPNPMSKTDPTPTPVGAPTPVVTPTPVAAPIAIQGDFNETIGKALDTKLTEAVSSAFDRVLNSEDFNKKVDQAIAEKLLNKLGSTVVPNEIKTFPVPRAGDVVVKTNGGASYGIDPALAKFASLDGTF